MNNYMFPVIFRDQFSLIMSVKNTFHYIIYLQNRIV